MGRGGAKRNGVRAVVAAWVAFCVIAPSASARKPLSCPRSSRARAAAKKKSRKLSGSGSGRFRTTGQFSSATVRGTRWLTQDRCESTTTRVVTGVVAVRDNIKRKTVTVRAGRSYTARRR